MRILVHPHAMEVGGSQINAVELAAAVRDRGHEVLVYGPDGVLVDTVRELGLEMVLAPPRRATPSPASARALVRLVRERGIDLVHAYEWNATLDTMAGPGWLLGTPVLSTILSMDVPHFLPRTVPMVVGTRQMQVAELRWRPEVHLMEPPIDTGANAPGAVPDADVRAVRTRWGIGADEALVVVVGRIAPELKLEGLLGACDATALLDPALRVRLLVVGDGPSRALVAERAAKVNADLGREAVVLTGTIDDPRPVYAAADVVLGMGGSALRGMAFARPLIVQGEDGFWSALSPDSLPGFLENGWYGRGDGAPGGPRLAALLTKALQDPQGSAARGALGRQVVVERFSLTAAAEHLETIYRSVAARAVPATARGAQAARTTVTVAKHRLAVRAERGLAVARARAGWVPS
ncbi:putative phosphatidylinositol alpha-mannosyltransferase [Actinomycetota bacterium]|nr:putative phosphatidylinositol alpha-mannosyltransferase [Actinomycetota bacterium]